MDTLPENPERTVALRKLLESKDAVQFARSSQRNNNMCLDASTFFNEKWLRTSITDEAPVRSHLSTSTRSPCNLDPPMPPEPEWSRARADVFVLSIETELYASVMYDKRGADRSTRALSQSLVQA